MEEEFFRFYKTRINKVAVNLKTTGRIGYLALIIESHYYEFADEAYTLEKANDFMDLYRDELRSLETEEELVQFLEKHSLPYKRIF